VGAFRSFGRDFLRALLAMVIGQVALLGCAGLVLTAIPTTAVWLLPVFSVLINGCTVALLPALLDAPAVPEGFANAMAAVRIPALWGIVLLQHVLIGFVVYFDVSGVTVTEENSPGRSSRHTERWTRTGTYTTATWTGAYESDFRWHDKLMADIVRSRGWPVAVVLLAVLGTFLAIVVKIEVIRRMPRRGYSGGDVETA
jgi:hypothetical protein